MTKYQLMILHLIEIRNHLRMHLLWLSKLIKQMMGKVSPSTYDANMSRVSKWKTLRSPDDMSTEMF